MAALPAEAYADPEIVVSNAEEGDVIPRPRRHQAVRCCFTCEHVRSVFGVFHAELRHPCALGGMPGRSGACRRFTSR